MISLLLILLMLSYSKSSEFSEEIVMKKFNSAGEIEALVEDPQGIYYLIQLDLKNDSLYNIINNKEKYYLQV